MPLYGQGPTLYGWEPIQRSVFDCGTGTGTISFQFTATNSNTTNVYTWPQQTSITSGSLSGWFKAMSFTWYARQGLAQQQWQKAPGILSRKTKRRLAREQREYEAMMARERKRSEEVKERARALLTRNLNAEQRDSLERNGYFDLNIGGKHYRIRQGTHGNVRLVVGDREVTSFCIQPNDVPAEDAMLAQKLLLETDEASFLRIANARQLVLSRP